MVHKNYDAAMNTPRPRGRPANPLQRKKRSEAILKAAGELISEHGLQQTTMKDIGEAVGLSLGALYRYFASKDDIVLAIADQEAQATDALITSIEKGGSLIGTLDDLMDEIVAWLIDPVTARLTIELSAEALRNQMVADAFRQSDTRLKGAFVNAIERDRQNAAGNPDLKPETGAFILLSLFDGMALRAAFGEEPSKDDLARQLRQLWSDALS